MSGYNLDSLERTHLADQGYVLREAVFSAKEVASIANSCEAVLARAASGPPTRKIQMGKYLFEINPDLVTVVKWEPEHPDQLQGLEPFAHFDSALEAWGKDPRFVDPMRDILDTADPSLFTEKLNVKRAHVGGAIFLHQDRPYWVENSENADEIATAVLFLDDATRINGCLEVVPGSHLTALAKGREMEGFGSFEMDPDHRHRTVGCTGSLCRERCIFWAKVGTSFAAEYDRMRPADTVIQLPACGPYDVFAVSRADAWRKGRRTSLKFMFYPTCSDEQLRFFRDNGYLVVEGAVASDDVAEVREHCDVIVEKRHKLAFDWAWEKGTSREDRKFRIVQGSPSHIWPEINEMRFRQWMIGFAADLLGKPVEFWYDQYLAKPPHEGCPSRIFMQPLEDSNDGDHLRSAIQRSAPACLISPGDRPARRSPKTGACATDGNNPDTRTEVA